MQIEVPVHLAITQSVIMGIREQYKIVNRCILHMMYRKLNLLEHLKAMKMFFMSGNGDILA